MVSARKIRPQKPDAPGYRALATASALIVVLILGAFQLQSASRIRQVSQDVRQAIVGARTAIEAGDLALARQRVAEAQGRLQTDRVAMSDLAEEVDRIRREIETRQADETRFKQFLKLASDAQDKMAYTEGLGGESMAEEALRLYGASTDDHWISRLESSYLTKNQKEQVRETTYVTLVSLADFGVRWRGRLEDPESVRQSHDLLRRARAFHEPTRAFYFVRSRCHRIQGDAVSAEADIERSKDAPARTAWDHFLPGHTAGWDGDLDEAIRSYLAALAIQPDHFNSLFFLAMRLAQGNRHREAEAIAYFTACIALRPRHFFAISNRAECHQNLGQFDAAEADYSAAIAVADTAMQRLKAYRERCDLYSLTGQSEKARADNLQVIRVLEELVETQQREHGPDSLMALDAMAALSSAYVAEESRIQDAIALSEQTLEQCGARLGPDHLTTRTATESLAYAYYQMGRSREAVALFEQLMERARAADPEAKPISYMNGLAGCYGALGQPEKAEPLLRELAAFWKAKAGADSSGYAQRLAPLGLSLLEQHKPVEAEPILRECLAIREKTEPDAWSTANAASMLGGSLLGQQKYAEAEPLLLSGYEGLMRREETIPPDAKVRLTEAIERLVQLYEEWGRKHEADEWRAKQPLTKSPKPAETKGD